MRRLRHSGARAQRGSPVSIPTARGYGFRARRFAASRNDEWAVTVGKASTTLGLVLAGGLARRMGGGDKARIRIGGGTILARVLARLKPQVAAVILNANGNPL